MNYDKELNEERITRYIGLLSRRLFILLRSGIYWRPEYGPELAAINQELAELRRVIDQAHLERASKGAES